MTLADLPDEALCRIHPVEPLPDAADAAIMCASLDKLLQQFEREEAVGAAASTYDPDGFLVIAYVPVAAPLSGCRGDKLQKVLRHLEQRCACQILDVPPFALKLAGVRRLLTRAELRTGLRQERIHASDLVWNTVPGTLGAWRRAACEPLERSWLATLVARYRTVI